MKNLMLLPSLFFFCFPMEMPKKIKKSDHPSAAIWLMNGAGVKANGYGSEMTLQLGWRSDAAGDFDGDGKSDILLYKGESQQVAVWLMNGTGVKSGGNGPAMQLQANWYPVCTGDFDGDGKSDVLLENPGNKQVAVWLMNGIGVKNGGYGIPLLLQTGWRAVATGDFDGDGKSDILLNNSINKQVAVWLMNGTGVKNSGNGAAMSLQNNWCAVKSGDFDSDGKFDILLWNEMTQQIAVWLMNGTSAKTGGQGQAMQLQPGWGPSGTGDYDGNGKSDILLNHNGQVAVWLMNGVSVKTGGYGTAMQLQGNWYGVGSGDFDGDGKSDILLGKGYQDPTPK